MAPEHHEQQPLAIEDVAQPWYTRPSKWFTAFAVAGGLIALSRRNKRPSFDANPLRSKDPKYWLGPMDLGDAPPAPEGVTSTYLKALWDRTSGFQEHERKEAIDTIVQLYTALGRPSTLPGNTLEKLITVIDTSLDWPKWGRNIVNLKWLFEAAQDNPELLRWVWYTVHVPTIAALSPSDQQRVFKIIDAMPPKERWRVEWFYRSLPRLRGSAPDYHHGFLDYPTARGYTLEQALALPYKKFLESITLSHPVDGNRPVENLWLEAQEYLPKKSELKNLSTRAIVNFPKKAYLRAYRFLEKDQGLQEADRIHGAIGLAFTFGPDWKKWLVAMETRSIDAHDATFWLPEVPVPGLGRFLRRRFLEPATVTSEMISQMNLIADNWNGLPPAVKRDTTERIIKYITTARYENIRNEDFAEEAARWGVEEDEYEDMESRFIKATLKKAETGDTIPSTKVTSNRLKLFKLEHDDPRGLFLGRHTVCCQAPGLEAESSAWYGVESQNSAFYVVEDPTGNIAAQSWVWRHGDVIVFDNIEGPGIQSSKTRSQVFGMYHELAKKLLAADPSLSEARIGRTRDNRPGRPAFIDWGIEQAREKDIAIVPLPFDFLMDYENPYSDAHVQTILAKRGGGTEFFRGQVYMETLACLLEKAWTDEESSFYRDDDAVEALVDVITVSPFFVRYKIGDRILHEDNESVNAYNSCFHVDVFLESKTNGKAITAPAFGLEACLWGYYTDVDLFNFKQGFHTEGVFGGDRFSEPNTARTLIEGLDLDIHPRDFDLDPELPDESSPGTANYVVWNVDTREEYRWYKDEDEAWFVAGIMEGVNTDVHNDDLRIMVLGRIDEDEVKRRKEDGMLEHECWELEEDEWWCLVG